MKCVARMGVAKDILKALEEYPRQTPSSLQKGLGVSLSMVKGTLVCLNDLELIETISRGLYEITELGKYVLYGTDEWRIWNTKMGVDTKWLTHQVYDDKSESITIGEVKKIMRFKIKVTGVEGEKLKEDFIKIRENLMNRNEPENHWEFEFKSPKGSGIIDFVNHGVLLLEEKGRTRIHLSFRLLR